MPSHVCSVCGDKLINWACIDGKKYCFTCVVPRSQATCDDYFNGRLIIDNEKWIRTVRRT